MKWLPEEVEERRAGQAPSDHGSALIIREIAVTDMAPLAAAAPASRRQLREECEWLQPGPQYSRRHAFVPFQAKYCEICLTVG